MPETVVHFQIRMPPALHERLSSLARESKESLNAMIVEMLHEAVARREPSKNEAAAMAGQS